MPEALNLADDRRPERRARGARAARSRSSASRPSPARRASASPARRARASRRCSTRSCARVRARGETLAIVAVDPSSRSSGGALLGDRIRVRSAGSDPGVFVRSMAARERLGGISDAARAGVAILAPVFDHVFVETVGVGQSESEVTSIVDTLVFVASPGGRRRAPVHQGGPDRAARRVRRQQGRPRRGGRAHRARARERARARRPRDRRLAAAGAARFGARRHRRRRAARGDSRAPRAPARLERRCARAGAAGRRGGGAGAARAALRQPRPRAARRRGRRARAAAPVGRAPPPSPWSRCSAPRSRPRCAGRASGPWPSAIDALFEAMRRASPREVWSRGVELARAEAVRGVDERKGETLLRVSTRGGLLCSRGRARARRRILGVRLRLARGDLRARGRGGDRAAPRAPRGRAAAGRRRDARAHRLPPLAPRRRAALRARGGGRARRGAAR